MWNGWRASRKASRNSVDGHRNSINRRLKLVTMDIPFNIGHALLLPGGRFWRPRIGRARDAERACERRSDGRIVSRGYSVELVRPFPRLRSWNVLGIYDSYYFRGHNNDRSQSATRAIFGFTNIRTVGRLGVRSIDGLQALRKNFADHGQDVPHPTADNLLSAINPRLSQQFQFGETNYVHL